ncbi:TPA: hypothetical protein PBO82_004604 [Escherichia coli]|nr:hypothetical protein [Escherichia coli]
MFRNSFMIITTHFIAAISSIITIVLLPKQLSSKTFSLFFLFFFAFSVISWFYIYSYYSLQKNKVKKIINTIGFNGKIISYMDSISGKSIHLNTNNGDILTIDVNKNKINGYSFNEWSGFELDDCTLTMKFNDIDAPVFIIKSNGKIREFRHKLEAFGSNKYTTTNGFKELVQRKLSPC